ncbi:ATP-binding cassette domain-containing protein [Microbacterium aurantiacum]|uniref:ATP-binding cassette domain-containing protein n=1 Tax=Microbacterium aurantiacum TaxID=162393 RepID=UPI001FED0F57|nr:ATP-binding cassette domain-containing protein [Microbacterium aurantiacum]
MPEGQVLEFTRVTKRFNDVTAVSDFSARVEPGVVTAFLGPNGAGKTTTLRILLGQVRATSGTATIGGVPYADLRQPLRTIGAVLEETPYRPRRTANRQLTIAAKANGIPLSRIDEVLTMVGLAGEGETRLGGYSLGMRQRLNVATALLGDPGALVFDEPANGLDPEGIRWMRLLMRRLADEGRTVLVSSHVLSEVEQVADNVLVLSKGQLVLASGIEKLADPAAGSVVVDADDRAALTAALSAAGFDVEVLRSGLTVRGGDSATVGAVAAAAGIALSALVQRGPTLEDVFIDLVRGGTLEPRAEAVASQLVDHERNGMLASPPVGEVADLPDELDADDRGAVAEEPEAGSSLNAASMAAPVAAGVATAGAAGLFGAVVADRADDESASSDEDEADAEASNGVAGLFGDAVDDAAPADAGAGAVSDEAVSDEVSTDDVTEDDVVVDEGATEGLAPTEAESVDVDAADAEPASEAEVAGDADADAEAPAATGIEWHAESTDETVASADGDYDATSEPEATDDGASADEASDAPKPSFDDILFGTAAPVSATAATAAFSPVFEPDESAHEPVDADATGDAEPGDAEPAQGDAGRESEGIEQAPSTGEDAPVEANDESLTDADDVDGDEEHEGIEIFAALGGDDSQGDSDDHGDDDSHRDSDEHDEGGASDDADPRSAAVSSMLAAAARAYFEDEPKDYPLSPAPAGAEGESSTDDRAHWSVATTGVIDTVPLAGAVVESPAAEPEASGDDSAEPQGDERPGEQEHDDQNQDDHGHEDHGDENYGHENHGHEHHDEQGHDHHGDEHRHHD